MMLHIYRFQFPFYIVSEGKDGMDRTYALTGYDTKRIATATLKEMTDDEPGKTHSIVKADEIKEKGEKDPIYLAAIDCDLDAGRLCCYTLNEFVRLTFGKKNLLAHAQGVDPAQVTQWNNKNTMLTYTKGRGWVMSFERRVIMFD